MATYKVSNEYLKGNKIALPVTLRKDISGVVTDLMVKTVTDQVYQNDTTLTEIINTLNADVKTRATNTELQDLQDQFNRLVANVPEAYDTLKEIADWIELHKAEYEKVLAELDQRVHVELGKGLSANDFTDEFKEKLNALYTRAETEDLFNAIDTRIDSLTASDIAYTPEGEDRKTTTVTEALHNLEKGAFTCVETICDMKRIIGTPQAKPGMFVYVRDGDGKTYQLNDAGTEFVWFNNGVITQEMLTQILGYIEENYEASTLYNEAGTDYLLIK